MSKSVLGIHNQRSVNLITAILFASSEKEKNFKNKILIDNNYIQLNQILSTCIECKVVF